ncbi:uncharacterized protein LOC119654270 [Hermetia illucens]|uniref:uncharacterized protein LOC119654270 n=1 Tax=Hermetia illucens TaxID=343691 RepID=UPI0018CC54E6|nr:uncharacterized protein LOC119654270 [Hermetia illucens]
MGSDNTLLGNVRGKHGLGNCNDNGGSTKLIIRSVECQVTDTVPAIRLITLGQAIDFWTYDFGLERDHHLIVAYVRLCEHPTSTASMIQLSLVSGKAILLELKFCLRIEGFLVLVQSAI